MDYKRLARVQIKDAAKGTVTAMFAQFNSIDSDGDVTLPGAFTDGAKVVISDYNHSSWQEAKPIGKGVLRQTEDAAFVDAQFFMNTQHGRDTFEVVKELAADGLGEWSYGYEVRESNYGELEGEPVRFLVKQHVFEVSPVLRGAGVGTHTVSAKGAQPVNNNTNGTTVLGVALKYAETKVSRAEWNEHAVLASLAEGEDHIADLRKLFAHVDPTKDPGTKAAYAALHHFTDGTASVRACLIEIVRLNGAGGKSAIPAADRQAVYDHLKSHLEDDEFEVPTLSEGKKFQDEQIAALAAISSINNRAAEVLALRSRKGKTFSAFSSLMLEWMIEELRKSRALFDTPKEDATREQMRWIAEQRRTEDDGGNDVPGA